MQISFICWSTDNTFVKALLQQLFNEQKRSLFSYLLVGLTFRKAYILTHLICCPRSFSFFRDLYPPSTTDRELRVEVYHLQWLKRVLFLINLITKMFSIFEHVNNVTLSFSDRFSLNDPFLFEFDADPHPASLPLVLKTATVVDQLLFINCELCKISN